MRAGAKTKYVKEHSNGGSQQYAGHPVGTLSLRKHSPAVWWRRYNAAARYPAVRTRSSAVVAAASAAEKIPLNTRFALPYATHQAPRVQR